MKTLNGPTPTELPDGGVLTTAQLWDAIANHKLGPAIFLINVGATAHSQTIPGASRLPRWPGHDGRKHAGSYLDRIVQADRRQFRHSIVFFGADVKDWSGYNAGTARDQYELRQSLLVPQQHRSLEGSRSAAELIHKHSGGRSPPDFASRNSATYRAAKKLNGAITVAFQRRSRRASTNNFLLYGKASAA